MINKKKMIIWGAGKIGRGFLADLAYGSGYGITFIDTEETLIAKLNDKKEYHVHKLQSETESECSLIKGFDAIATSESNEIVKRLCETDLMALVVFPTSFEDVGKRLVQVVCERMIQKVALPLNILICTNITHPAEQIKSVILSHLKDDQRQYFENNIGLVECLVIRMAVQPEKKLINEDELVVVTNGYPDLIVDKLAFKGELPDISGLIFTENIRAEETRKMYTYNMVHALYAYIGIMKGHKYVFECTKDEEVQLIAESALIEISQGLIKEFGFSEDEVRIWNERVIKNMVNPILKDKLVRVGGDPIRKLKRDDRLTGAALLCRRNGIMPYFLSMAIAYGYLYQNEEDAASLIINKYVKEHGLKSAILEFSGLQREPDLIQLIEHHYSSAGTTGLLKQNMKGINKVKYAFERGFHSEKTYRGCGQCAILALMEVLAMKDDKLFQSASGLSGGMALCNDGSCGGYTGGIMVMSSFVGRKRERMLIDGDKEDQYQSFTMAQKLHDKFIETYGSVVCKDIQQEIFGQWFCLREKAVRDKFEQAGAHLDKCTSVIATTCAWVTEIMIEEGVLEV